MEVGGNNCMLEKTVKYKLPNYATNEFVSQNIDVQKILNTEPNKNKKKAFEAILKNKSVYNTLKRLSEI